MTDNSGQKRALDEKKEANCNLKKSNFFMRFLNWISRGSEKASKKGGGCSS